MFKRVLLITIFGLLISDYAFAERSAVREAVIKKNCCLTVVTGNYNRFIVIDLNKIKVVLDKKLDGTYVDLVRVKNSLGGRNRSGGAEIVQEMTIYVRTSNFQRTWLYAINSNKFPKDIVPTIE